MVKERVGIRKWGIALAAAVLFPGMLCAGEGPETRAAGDGAGTPARDSCAAERQPERARPPRKFVQRMGLEFRPAYIIPTSEFLRGDNEAGRRMAAAFSGHLKYGFRFRDGSLAERIYGRPWQGVGVAYYHLGNSRELGNPLAVYLFQSAKIAQAGPRLSLNYEWNFGLSFCWKPYDYERNAYNTIIGSRINAYLNAGVFLNWRVSSRAEVYAGAAATHFSNGNTRYPNSGLNGVSLKAGLTYDFLRKDSGPGGTGAGSAQEKVSRRASRGEIPAFRRHLSYDAVLFGSWRRKVVTLGEERLASPSPYPVLGLSFSPMWNFGYKFRAGVSLDGVWDQSANLYPEDFRPGTVPKFHKAPFSRQLAAGLAVRAEFVMPYFSVNVGLGGNLLHGRGDQKAFYQTLALKINVTESAYLHIGYNLLNFHTPNCLMLGMGIRFRDKYPVYYR